MKDHLGLSQIFRMMKQPLVWLTRYIDYCWRHFGLAESKLILIFPLVPLMALGLSGLKSLVALATALIATVALYLFVFRRLLRVWHAADRKAYRRMQGRGEFGPNDKLLGIDTRSPEGRQ